MPQHSPKKKSLGRQKGVRFMPPQMAVCIWKRVLITLPALHNPKTPLTVRIHPAPCCTYTRCYCLLLLLNIVKQMSLGVITLAYPPPILFFRQAVGAETIQTLGVLRKRPPPL